MVSPGASLVERRVDRGQPVGDPEVRDAAHALLDVVDDRAGILGARIVGGHDRQIGALRGDPAHDRPLAAVAVATAAEHHDEPSAA